MTRYVKKPNDNVFIGLMIGATIPVLGYILVENIFGLLESMGMMDEVSFSSAEKRQRTLALIGICFNIIPLQFLRMKRYDSILKGIMIATFIYCAAWFIHFRHGLFF